MGILYFHEGLSGSDKLTITGELWSDIKINLWSNNWVLRIPAELIRVNDKLITLLDVNDRVLFNDYDYINDLIYELWEIISSILDTWDKDLNIVQERVMLFLQQLGFNEVIKNNKKVINKEVINNKIFLTSIKEEEKKYWS